MGEVRDSCRRQHSAREMRVGGGSQKIRQGDVRKRCMYQGWRVLLVCRECREGSHRQEDAMQDQDVDPDIANLDVAEQQDLAKLVGENLCQRVKTG